MPSRHVSRCASLLALVVAIATLGAQDITLPAKPDSLKFAVIGDSGTGSSAQYRVAEMLFKARATFPYEFVIMMGAVSYTHLTLPTNSRV